MSGASAVHKQAKDWHSSKQIGKRARYLLEHPDEEIPSDVTFLVGNGKDETQKTFKCHKFILAMVSSMFQAMFYGSFPQTEDPIKIPDVTPTAFQHMLRYAYGETIELKDECLEDAMDILYCAKKYLIGKLARASRDHIQLRIVVVSDDPCVVFQRAPQMDEEGLADLALARIGQFTLQTMDGDGFTRLSFDCLQRVLDYPHLSAPEMTVYRGVRRWIEHNVGAVTGSALRDAFGSLRYSIRFPLFRATDLANGPVADGLLTSDEVSSLFQFRFSNVKPALPFPTSRRIPLADPLLCYFKLVTAPASALVGGLIRNHLFLCARPDLAPECCAFLRMLVESKSHIRVLSYDNEHVNKPAPLPAAVQDERNVLSHSAKGACWFEWDMDGDVARHIRIGTGRKPCVFHSAVFGFVVGWTSENQWAPFTWWDDKRIQGVAAVRIA